MTRTLAVAATAALVAGCALFPRRVKLTYTASKNAESRPRGTPLTVQGFLDRRKDQAMGTTGGLAPAPIKPSGSLTGWLTTAVSAELAAAGYKTTGGDWKVGGALKEASCGSGKRTICKVKIEAWVTMKDNWQALRSEYSGEGLRPPMFAGEDPYSLSLEEGLREALAAFRRDVERLVP